METLSERVAGRDVHKDTVVAGVRVPGPGGRREAHSHEFGTTTAGLLALRDRLVAHAVSRCGMEATGADWKPVYYAREDEVERWSLNARHLRNVPGRKTATSPATARPRSRSAPASPSALTRCSRTPASSSPRWPRR